MSISESLQRGVNMWATVQNIDLQKRQMAVFEAQEARAAEAHSYRQLGGAHERDFKLLEAYEKDEEAYGENTAFSAFLSTYDGDLDAMLQDPIGSQIALKYIKQGDTEISRRLGSNKGWEAAGIVRNDDDTYSIRLRNISEGRDANLTEDRGAEGKGSRKVDLTADEVHGGVIAAGMEKGLPKDEYIQVVQESYGVTPEVANAIAEEATKKINYAPSFNGVLERVKRNKTEFGRIPEILNDVVVDDGISLGKLAGGYAEKSDNKVPDFAKDKNDRYKQNAAKLAAGLSGISDGLGDVGAFIADTAAGVKNKVVDIDRFVRSEFEDDATTLGDKGVKGLFDKAGKQLSDAKDFAGEVAGSVGDAVSDIAGYIWHGKSYKTQKEADVKAGNALASNKPEEVERAQTEITESMAKAPPEKRIQIGQRDLEYLVKNIQQRKGRTGKPKASARAAAARLYANGMLPQSAYSTYLETGRFSYDDVEAAARINTSRANMMRAKTAHVEAVRKFGKDVADDKKDTFDTRVKGSQGYLKQSIETRGLQADPAYMSSLLEQVYHNKQIIGAIGVESPLDLTDEHMKAIADWFVEKEVPKLKRDDRGFFSGTVAYTPHVNVQEFTKYLQDKTKKAE